MQRFIALLLLLAMPLQVLAQCPCGPGCQCGPVCPCVPHELQWICGPGGCYPVTPAPSYGRGVQVYPSRPQQQPQQQANVPAHVVAASVRISAGQYGGSGTIIAHDATARTALVLTCQHLFRSNERSAVKVYLPNGQSYHGVYGGADTMADLATVTILDVPHDIPRIPVADRAVSPGEQVWQVGYPARGKEQVLTKRAGTARGDIGFVKSGAPVLTIRMHVDQGDSGSGLFRTDGTLVGVVWGGGNDTSASGHADVTRFLNEKCFKWAWSGQPQPPRQPLPQPQPGPSQIVGPAGPQGPAGPAGPAGKDADVSPALARIDKLIASLETTLAGASAATAKAEAAASAAAAATGKPGATGPAGPQGPTGPVGPTGPAGAPGKDANVVDLQKQIDDLNAKLGAITGSMQIRVVPVQQPVQQ